MRILLADGDATSRRHLESTLTKWGYDLVVCSDGRDVLLQLQQESPPDIAILDCMMPHLDGPEVCRRLRKKPDAAPIYIILLSASGQPQDLVDGLHAGADDYMKKPFNREELFARLQCGIRITNLQRKLAAKVKDLEVALADLRRAQQAQKLESLGRLASGVAHEINTPVQYISNNIQFLNDSWETIRRAMPDSHDDDLDFVLQEGPRAIEQSIEGVGRISKIVRAMRDFSLPATENKVMTDINRALEATITISANEWKHLADVETEFDPDLPKPLGLPGELHEVFLTIVLNAAESIARVHGETGRKGIIKLKTLSGDGHVEIRIGDNGAGIPEEHRSKIFEPFFTTKDVGKGTGQALAIAHSVIVKQHNGRIWFETESGEGTTFVIQLPVDRVGS